MKTMTRYVLGQLLAVFLVTLGIMTLSILTIVLGIEARQQGLGLVQIVQLIPFMLPDALQFSVPATVLFSTCLVYGRMGSSNEVVALKSLGISPWSIIWPMLVAVTIISLSSVWLNDVAASWGRNGVKRVVIGSIEEIAYNHLRSQRSFSTKRFSITVRDVVDRRLMEPLVSFQADQDTPAIVIRAEWAELHADPANDTLTILLHNGSATGNGVSMDFLGTEKRILPLSDQQKNGRRWVPAEMPLWQIPQSIAVQKKRLEDLRQRMAARAGFELLAGNLGELAPARWQESNGQVAYMENQLHRLEAESCRRWASGFSCLCFALIGAPLAIRARNYEVLTSFFICFLPILLVYYPLFQYSLDRAKAGSLPPIGLWIANAAVAAWGCWMLRRVMRY